MGLVAEVVTSYALHSEVEPVGDPRVASALLVDGPLAVYLPSWKQDMPPIW